MKLHVYVAAPYQDAERVRHLHVDLGHLNMVPTSRWAEGALGPEDFTQFTPAQLRGTAEANDTDIARSHAMIVLAREGAGGEMFADARLAACFDIPTFWCGRLTLSAWRSNVVRSGTPGKAMALLVRALEDDSVHAALTQTTFQPMRVRHVLSRAIGLIKVN